MLLSRSRLTVVRHAILFSTEHQLGVIGFPPVTISDELMERL